MNSVSIGSFHPITPPLCKFHQNLQLKHQQDYLCGSAFKFSSNSLKSKPIKPISTLLQATESDTDAQVSIPEGSASVVYIEEVVEKDWSILDSVESNSNVEFKRSIERIVSAGNVEEGSRVLVSTGSEEFVDTLVGLCKSLFVVHDSLLILALIKEKYDKVKCWQGEIVYVPEKWAPLDVVFLYFLPALPFKLDEILGSLAKKCSPVESFWIEPPILSTRFQIFLSILLLLSLSSPQFLPPLPPQFLTSIPP
ncbi:uncharacterized protein LOC107470279 isoform X3 [Arachis duranensis]|uniref:Uncharacterized protein LOC107470279 isoform X3 n=1 Tax=Arachis duranensis TaxID=130453 RepID=A0A9C6T788_ARADU|nr:uncharacterized protein LOC107470279 isoform X3 [Arachis duranensis]XP_052111237.1 uncharacterized protein LOC107470279 isoform X3 [Arachis duranensis]XP_052111238.1 uncharacterized protein LOC107470279 isoform X3 [Arachis duranensis]XP_052111239.1 uncharacterized protein LOC107470279 isoform X3 [Arachis duranensis]